MSLQLDGCSPQLIFKAEIGAVIGFARFSPPDSFSFPYLIIFAQKELNSALGKLEGFTRPFSQRLPVAKLIPILRARSSCLRASCLWTSLTNAG